MELANANLRVTTSGSREEDAGILNGFIDGFKAAIEVRSVREKELVTALRVFTCDHQAKGRDWGFGCCRATEALRKLGYS